MGGSGGLRFLNSFSGRIFVWKMLRTKEFGGFLLLGKKDDNFIYSNSYANRVLTILMLQSKVREATCQITIKDDRSCLTL